MATELSTTGLQNSTSYADVAGLPAGLDRLAGETSDQYLDRLLRSTVEDRSHAYEGIVAEIALQFALGLSPGIRIEGPADTTITCDLSGLVLVHGDISLTCPIVTLDEDDTWTWNSLSQIVAQINQSKVWTATLLVNDAPAVQLCRQTNAEVTMPYELVISEVGLIGLSEPSLSAIAVTPTGGLAYVVREFLQAIRQRDRSYWAQ